MSQSKFILLFIGCMLVASCAPVQTAEPIAVIHHPDGPLYVGDQVSFEVLAPTATNEKPGSIIVAFNGQELGSADFAPFGIGGRRQATLWWIWDTHGLNPGSYTLTFSQLPENTTWTQTFSLHSMEQIPSLELGAQWMSTVTVCCNLYYISGTAADRDIATLAQEADEQSAVVSAQMGATLSERINITFISRVVGHGGFTWNGIYVSYLDSNYINNDASILLHHEFVHYYDTVLGGSYLPTMLEEGLAVYLTGGHFKPEPLGPRASALLIFGWYIPLTALANDFYNQQHDIGYLEAGALVMYLVETYGWDAFNEFYRTIHVPVNETVSDVIDAALQDHFDVSFAGVETAYIAYLRSQAVTDNVGTDLRLTISFFDTVRRYQKALDPSAYFMTAWLPDGSAMRQRGIIADFLRRPEGWRNRLLESLLIHSRKELLSRNYVQAGHTLELADKIIEIIAH